MSTKKKSEKLNYAKLGNQFTCLGCNRQFVKKAIKASYCSNRCKQKAYYWRNRPFPSNLVHTFVPNIEEEKNKIKMPPFKASADTDIVIVTEDPAILKMRIRELEKLLNYSNLKAETLDEMITIAEATFNINIRKKSGAKQ